MTKSFANLLSKHTRSNNGDLKKKVGTLESTIFNLATNQQNMADSIKE